MLFRHGDRTHRAKRVSGLADEELLVVSLFLASGNVVDDGVAPDVGHGVVLVDFERGLVADDDADFAFVVEGLGEGGVRVDRLAAGDDAGGTFGEDDRVAGLVDFVRRVVAGLVEFCSVRGVVLADGEDVPAGQGREKFDGGEGNGVAAGGVHVSAELDDLVQ